MLQVLMPVTRSWTRREVIAAIAASDIPRGEFILVHDAPDTGPWARSLRRIGFDVTEYHTGADGVFERRARDRRPRQALMREFTRTVVGDGPLLILDDDAIVPPDVYARLSAAGPHACGVQVSRYDKRHCGVYRGAPLVSGRGVEPIERCGHYCLLTTGEMYRREWWERVGGYDEAMRHGYEDWDFWTRVAAAGAGFTWLDEVLFYYRRYPEDRSDVTGSLEHAQAHHSEIREYMRCKYKALGILGRKRSTVRLGVPVDFMGRHYPRGSRIAIALALEMKAAGVIQGNGL